MDHEKLRYTFSSFGKSLPLFIESIGYNPQEEDFARPEGYPYFHWLQTVKGEGMFSIAGKRHVVSAGKGILLTPFTPHSYYANSADWSTIYITFGGASAESILDSLEINANALYSESKELSFSRQAMNMLEHADSDSDLSKLDLSGELYKFLIMLKKFSNLKNQQSLSSNYDKIRPVVDWLEHAYSENIGLAEMAERADMSPQNLSALFRTTFGTSPYSFLISLRIREAKKKLASNSKGSLKEIAASTGFNDVSHFVATFRRVEGITPKKYRNLYQ